MTDDGRGGGFSRLLVGDGVSGNDASFVLPTGTVTFVLTDVESSSRTWELVPDTMTLAIPRQYAILDEAIATHGGVRPVEQGEGDSVVAAFSRASDAVAAALEAQQALHSEAWPDGAHLRVRMAVHTGEAQLRDVGNYFGQAVIRCARLRAIGHGGQVLLSDATATLVAERLPEGAGLADLGIHRLKDLGRPERVWQLLHSELPTEFPALRSLDAFRHNLPVQLTPLVGRDREMTDLGRLLADERLVTLTGSGGVGKTRLAMAVAADAIERFPGGIWVVELAGVGDATAVGAATLAAVGAHESPTVRPVSHLAMELGEEPSLLVMDNCEHLIDACAELVAGLLAANPSASVLATSREPLGVPSEVTWRVPSLTAPTPELAVSVPALSQYEAVRLFVDRAKRARPSFRVSEDNAPAVAQICYRLDGIPLALELAVARCRQMPVERIAHDLDDRFRLLTGGARTALPRQQTLAASVDWSYDRLGDDEQAVFRRLGVFAGPFPLESAEAVAASPVDIEAVQVFDLLSQLVDKSLVVAEDGRDGEPRYRLLETLRAYALDHARTCGELSGLRDAHVAFWIGWLEGYRSDILTDACVEQVEAVDANLAAALEWSLGDAPTGLRLLRLLALPWEALCRYGPVLAAVDRLLTDENATRYPALWVQAANATAEFMWGGRGPRASQELAQRAERAAAAGSEPFDLALARLFACFTDDLKLQLAEDALDLARIAGERHWAASLQIFVAELTLDGEPLDSASLLDRAEFVEACQQSSHLAQGAAETRAKAARSTGDLTQCIELARGIVTRGTLGNVESGIYLLSASALLAADEATLELAVEVAERRLAGLPIAEQGIDLARHRLQLMRGAAPRVEAALRVESLHPLVTGTIHLLGREAIAAGEAEFVVRVVRAEQRSSPHFAAVLAALEGAAGPGEAHWHDALALAAGHGLRLIAVDALEGLASAAATSEGWIEALRLAGAAERLRDETGYRWRFGCEQQALDDAVAASRTGLGADAADAALADGRALDWQEAAAYTQRARGERKRPRHGWASLTPTEEQVVALVAQGLTNPEIAERLLMGRATVKSHLEHVFTKTGLHTRAELAVEQTRRAAD